MRKNHNQSILSVATLPASKEVGLSIISDGKIVHVQDAKLIRLLSEAFQIPYKLLIPADNAVGVKLPDGNWTGKLGMVKSTEADLAVGGIGLTEERFQAINFSYPYTFSQLSFMTNKPKPISSSLILLSPFSLEVWISLAILILSVSFLLFFLTITKESYECVLYKVFCSLLEKSIHIKRVKRNMRLIIGAWILCTFVITNSYKAVLSAFHSIPTVSGIQDILDLAKAAEENSVTCFINKGSFFTEIFLQSDIDSWKSIGKCLKRNITEGFLTYPGKKAVFGPKSYLGFFAERYFIPKESFLNFMGAFPVSRDFCCLEKLNNIIHRIFAAGLFQKLFEDQNRHVKVRLASSHAYETDLPKKLGIRDLKGAFLILFCGYTLAFAVLLVEMCLKRLRQVARKKANV